MKALIVGGKGQLGSTLSQTVPPNIEFQSLDLPEIDIVDLNSVQKAVFSEKPDVIVNAAAYTAVDHAENEADLAFAINATGPRHLAIAAKKAGARLIHISTDYVFDGTANTPYPPDAICNPLCVYGKSKYEGEINVLKEINDAIILRTSWLYSQYGSNFVLTMLRLMRERNKLNIVSDQIGCPTSTLTLASVIWSVAEKRNIKGIYHSSDAGAASWYDFAIAIQEEALSIGILKGKIPIIPILTRDFPQIAKRPSYSLLDCTESWRAINTTPIHWRRALRKIMEHLKS